MIALPSGPRVRLSRPSRPQLARHSPRPQPKERDKEPDRARPRELACREARHLSREGPRARRPTFLPRSLPFSRAARCRCRLCPLPFRSKVSRARLDDLWRLCLHRRLRRCDLRRLRPNSRWRGPRRYQAARLPAPRRPASFPTSRSRLPQLTPARSIARARALRPRPRLRCKREWPRHQQGLSRPPALLLHQMAGRIGPRARLGRQRPGIYKPSPRRSPSRIPSRRS
jgi:hypothetical protein